MNLEIIILSRVKPKKSLTLNFDNFMLDDSTLQSMTACYNCQKIQPFINSVNVI